MAPSGCTACSNNGNDDDDDNNNGSNKDYRDPPPLPLLATGELTKWSLYRAAIAEFTATLLFVYLAIATVIGHNHQSSTACSSGAGILGIAWSFGGTIFVLVYSTAGISGGHINPAVTFALLLARKVTLLRATLYVLSQCAGAVAGAALARAVHGRARAVHGRARYLLHGGGANELAPGFSPAAGLGAEVVGTFVLVYTVFSATDPKRKARDCHVPVLAPLPIGFAVFMVHLATIPITGTGINPARSLGAAVAYNGEKAWAEHWIFWVGPLLGAAFAMVYHEFLLRGKAMASFRSNYNAAA